MNFKTVWICWDLIEREEPISVFNNVVGIVSQNKYRNNWR